ncbi:MAG TPA: SUMF1/EgtB/PvdO family nonheme iron enzyme [Saprospiraceae bacterium]|nr:SUMF1/EgtB/PvdO family nonheme iron enzyme [Saprospiraceae bacterium]
MRSIWAPGYSKKPLLLPAVDTTLYLQDHFGTYEGLFVVQLIENAEVVDQRSLELKAGTPRLISRKVSRSGEAEREGMVRIPGGDFRFRSTHGDAFISYPEDQEDRTYPIESFLMDKHPVTNGVFAQFLEETGYWPADDQRFLMHWPEGVLPDSLRHHPVVYISYEDAQAYAKWAGKRLPNEVEWQYAAQAGDDRSWPWTRGTQDIYREEEPVTNTLTVYKIKGIEASRCNLGDGQLDPIGTYPEGANPYGLEDLVGSVWQLTNDIYRSGSYTYIIMKGGSYFNPSSSWWYVQGGPRELHYRQYLLRVAPGFERNATVGFRCVQDLSTD